MTSLSATTRTVILAALGSSLFAGAAYAQAAPQQMPQGWFKSCNKQADVDVCTVQQIITASTGQLVTAVSLLEVKGKVNRKVFQVSVPTGRLMPPGIGLQIDGGKTTKLEYMLCFPDRCLAEVPLTDAMVGSFKKGTNLVLTSVNFQNQPNPVRVTLNGFTGVYDGEPVKQADLQERQKKLEAFIKQNNEDLNKKLKEEQEKAKAVQ